MPVVTDASSSGGWIAWMPTKKAPPATAARPAQRMRFEAIVCISLLLDLAVRRFGIDPDDRDQRQAQIAHLREQAVQGRLVGHRPADDGRAVGRVAEAQALEPGAPPAVEVPLEPDLVPPGPVALAARRAFLAHTAPSFA